MTAPVEEREAGLPTDGPYQRAGRTVYVLHEGQVRRYSYAPLTTAMVNRWSALVQPHAGCSETEAEAVAKLFTAAPDLAAALIDMRRRFHAALVASGTDPEFADIACERADAALSAAGLGAGRDDGGTHGGR